jgi:chemotaxis protein CheX
MDIRYINPFVGAVQNIFNTMINLPFKLGKPYLKKDRLPHHEISAIIGLSGSVSGCVVINLSQAIALELVSALTGETVTELNDDCTDAIGEIANMVAGNAKTDFPGKNNAISVPSVIIGKHEVSYPTGLPIIVIPIELDKGQLAIEIAIKTLE